MGPPIAERLEVVPFLRRGQLRNTIQKRISILRSSVEKNGLQFVKQKIFILSTAYSHKTLSVYPPQSIHKEVKSLFRLQRSALPHFQQKSLFLIPIGFLLQLCHNGLDHSPTLLPSTESYLVQLLANLWSQGLRSEGTGSIDSNGQFRILRPDQKWHNCSQGLASQNPRVFCGETKVVVIRDAVDEVGDVFNHLLKREKLKIFSRIGLVSQWAGFTEIPRFETYLQAALIFAELFKVFEEYWSRRWHEVGHNQQDRGGLSDLTLHGNKNSLIPGSLILTHVIQFLLNPCIIFGERRVELDFSFHYPHLLNLLLGPEEFDEQVVDGQENQNDDDADTFFMFALRFAHRFPLGLHYVRVSCRHRGRFRLQLL